MASFEPTEEEMAEYAEWIRTRPDAVRAVMDRFPPTSYVRAREGQALVCPAPGEVGVVERYTEEDDGRVTLYVVCYRGAGRLAGQCDPDWLEVIESAEQAELYERARALAVRDAPARGGDS